MILTIGKKTNKELAEWFGVKENTFNHNKQKRLEELKIFANYHMEGSKVIIDEVIYPEYCKQGSVAYQKIRDKVDEVWSDSGLDSCSRVGDEIYEILNEDKNFKLTIGTVYNYTIKGRNELYGKPFVGGGKIGNCIYMWCKRDKETGEYSFLTEEEKAIKERLQTKYFGDVTEKQILVKGMIAAGEISKEEAWSVLEEMTGMNNGNFMGFLKELQDAIGCQVVRGTLVDRNKEIVDSAF